MFITIIICLLDGGENIIHILLFIISVVFYVLKGGIVYEKNIT